MKPVHIAFLGCGFITGVHSRHMRKMRRDVVRSYASRDAARAAERPPPPSFRVNACAADLCIIMRKQVPKMRLTQ